MIGNGVRIRLKQERKFGVINMFKRRFRRHHNNKGYRQIKNGQTINQVKRIAKKLNLKYEKKND